MSLVNLPSAKDAKSIEEVIDVVENMRKQMEYLFNNVQNDNINGQISANKLIIGANSTFETGYNPSSKIDYDTYALEIAQIHNQLDGVVDSYFYDYNPSLINNPASLWITDIEKATHIGDTFTNTVTGYSWRFLFKDGTYQWIKIADSDAQLALQLAAAAQDTADHKRRVFVGTPVVPYDVGDLWVQGSAGDIMACTTARNTGSYLASDWEKSSKYTDDTGAFQAEANAIAYANALKTGLVLDIGEVEGMVTGLTTYVETTFKDGIITEAEAIAIGTHINQVNTEKADVDSRYTTIYAMVELTGTEKTDFATAKTNFDTAHTNLIASINTAIADGATSVAEKTDVDTKFATYKTTLGALSTAFENAINKIASVKAANTLEAAKAFTNTVLGGLQTQLDGKVETWFYSGVPTLVNVPASVWTTTVLKDAHLNDLYFDLTTKQAYRFKVVATVYSWELLQDVSIQTALTNASTAQATADSKMVVFVTQPVPPYDIGDLWAQGVSGDIMTCVVARASGFYVAADWKRAGNRIGTYIDQSGVYTGKISFDQGEGGTLKLGAGFGEGELNVFNSLGNVTGRIDTEGAYFPKVQSDNIIGNVVNKWWNYNMTFWVDCDGGNDANGGGSSGAPKKSLQTLLDSLPKDLNNKWINIRCSGTNIGNIRVAGFRHGIIQITEWDNTWRMTIKGQFVSEHNDRVLLQNVRMDGPIGGNPLVLSSYDKEFYAYAVKCYGGNGTSHGFWMESSNFILGECHVYGLTDRGLYASRNSKGYFYNGHGTCPIAILTNEAGQVIGTGSRWAGTPVRWGYSMMGGYNAGGTDWINDIWSVDYGEASPPVPPPPTEQTLTINPSTGDNYSTSGYWTNDEVKQGNWGYGDRYGLWYTDLSAVKGKTILSATITVYRASGGTNAARTAYFRTHNYTARGSRPGGAPAMSTEYNSGAIAVGQTATFDITSLIQTKIASGPDRSVGVYTTGQTDYMSLGTTPTIVIRYR